MPKRARQAAKSPSSANTENDNSGATDLAPAATTSTGVDACSNGSASSTDILTTDPKHLAMQTLCDAWTHTKSLPGCLVGVWKDDKEVCYIESHSRDKPAYNRSDIFRIFSMTKPVTAVCILQLVAQGRVALSDPVHKYIPGFKDFRVLSKPSPDAPPPPPLAPGVDLKDVPLDTEPLNCDITLLHLLTHTSGLNYGIFSDTVVDRYLKNAFGYPALKTWLMKESLETIVDKICTSGSYVDGGNGPVGKGGLLEFQPGTHFLYGLNFDVLGRVIELVSGIPLDTYMHDNVFTPLGMTDTAFYIDGETDKGKAQLKRLVPCYDFVPGFGCQVSSSPGRDARLKCPQGSPQLLMGGGGLVSTLDDFHKFCRALMREGEGLPHVTPELMRSMHSNYLPDGHDMATFGHGAAFSESVGPGVGQGLGVGLSLDPLNSRGGEHCSNTEFGWGGVASTLFSVDPKHGLIFIFLTQLCPSPSTPVRTQTKWLAHKLYGGNSDGKQ